MATLAPETPTIEVCLPSGETAEMRPLLPADAPLLIEGMASLSEESRFSRFGVGVDSLSGSEVRYLTEVDQRHHVAIGATIGGEAAGVGRYVVVPEANCAEVAITVVDDFQHRGLGTALLTALTSVAFHDGVQQFCFEVAPSNQAVRRFLEGWEGRITPSGFWEVVVPVAELPRSESHDDIVALVEAAR